MTQLYVIVLCDLDRRWRLDVCYLCDDLPRMFFVKKKDTNELHCLRGHIVTNSLRTHLVDKFDPKVDSTWVIVPWSLDPNVLPTELALDAIT